VISTQTSHNGCGTTVLLGGCGGHRPGQTINEPFKVTKITRWEREGCGPGASSVSCEKTEVTTYEKKEVCN
jgi:hypothetical protein